MNREATPHPAGDAQTVRAVFDHLPTPLGAFEGPELRCVAANAALRALLPRRPLLGARACEAFPAETRTQVSAMMELVYTTGGPRTATGCRFRSETDAPDGPQESFRDLMFLPHRDACGQTRGVIVHVTDVAGWATRPPEDPERAAEADRRYRNARDAIAEFQRGLLPPSLPVLPGVTLAGEYLIAGADQSAGGDWFDAVPLPGGRIALMVGDVVGHGPAASAAMGRLRAVLDAVLVETTDLTCALGMADRLAQRTPAMHAATACVAVLEPLTGSLVYSTCGHPSPLVVPEDGAARSLRPSGGQPLGTGAPIICSTAVLRSGETLVLYSDGLVEHTREPLLRALSTPAQAAGDPVATPATPLGAPVSTVERACRSTVELLTRNGAHDDLTVLAAQRRSWPVAPWRSVRPATADQVLTLRDELRGWVDEVGPSDRDRHAVDLAVTELLANVVEHAYLARPAGPMRLSAELGPDGVLAITVGDDGAWRPPGEPAAASGRGLWLVRSVLDELSIDSGDGTFGGPERRGRRGTTVTVRQRLSRPTRSVPVPAPGPDRRPTRPFSTEMSDGAHRFVRVTGSIDVSTAGRLADRIDVATRGGLHPVAIDLTDVDVLASAGVRVLFGARDRLAANGHQLDLVAGDGCAARTVLDLVGLPYRPR